MIIVAILILPGIFLIMPSAMKDTSVSASSSWVQTSDSDFRNGTSNSLTILDSGSDAKLLIDFPEFSNSWNEQDILTSPGYRHSHAMATIYNSDNVLLYSGYYYDSLNFTYYQYTDTWIYDLSYQQWFERSPTTNPGFRTRHGMAGVFGTDKVILFGGYSGTYLNDTWVYDLSDNTWTRQHPKTSPSSIYYFSMASVYGDDKIVLYDGGYGTASNGETWIYDLSENNWVKKTLATSPGVLMGHQLATIPRTDKVLLFGGMDTESNLLNDTWVYDVSDNRWLRKITSEKPEARYLHAMAAIAGIDRVLLFGGYYSTPDTWVYDYSDNTWTKKAVALNPAARYYTGMAAVNGTKNVLLFGGITYSNRVLNDTWVYEQQFLVNSGTFESQPLKLTADAVFKDLIWNATTTHDNIITFQLRSAMDEAHLDSEPYLGPDGTTSSLYTSSPGEIWEGHNSHRCMQYKVYFEPTNADGTPILHDVTITFNYLPTNFVILPINRAILPNNFPKFRWTFDDIDSSHQIGFQVLIGNNPNFNDLVFDSGEQNSNQLDWEFPVNTSYSYLPKGTWYWKVRTKDSDGDWGLFTPPWQFNIDSRSPWSNVTWPEHRKFYNEINEITGHAANYLDSNDIKKVEILIKCENDNTSWDGSGWQEGTELWLETSGINNWSYDSSSVIWTSGYQYSIQSRAVDLAANIGSANAHVFTFDSDIIIFSNPIPESGSYSDSESVSVGITITDFISGVNSASVSYAVSTDTGMSWGPWVSVPGLKNGSSIINVSKNIKLANGTGNRIKWRAEDLAGNGPTESEIYTINIDTRLKKLKPDVNLLNPVNDSIITKSKVELKWSLVNVKLTGMTYDILLDIQNPPLEVFKSDHDETSLIVEDLSNQETYYWTVVPKNGAVMGECLSGVWSFSVELNLELPEIVLSHPLNEQTIITKRPSLQWYADYYGEDIVTYDVYFDTDPNPKRIVTGHTGNRYNLDYDLEDHQTYYWRIVPRLDGKIGQGSEIWWFSVDTSYMPIDELRLMILTPDIVVKQDDFAQVDIQIKNFGKLKDVITINVIIPPELIELNAYIPPPNTVEIGPGQTIDFNLTILAGADAELGEFEITIELSSLKALELGLESKRTGPAYVTVIENPDIEPKVAGGIDYTPFIYLTIVVIIFLIVVYMRVERDRIFRNVLRKVIYKTIEENPGIHFRKIMRELDLKPGVLAYHLNILEKKEYIKSRQKGIYRCFYLSTMKTDFKIVLSTLQQNILITIQENPGITLTELSNTLGKNKMVLNYNTHKLEDAGMIKKEKTGRIVSYSTTALAAIYIS